ncbi:hypothetical protein B0H34DRAFT_847399 [Crassisporium funariophilum]|nr:hypothetical protein B0H34DRAFT_847399 [Crassisporium funariophilum]
MFLREAPTHGNQAELENLQLWKAPTIATVTVSNTFTSMDTPEGTQKWLFYAFLGMIADTLDTILTSVIPDKRPQRSIVPILLVIPLVSKQQEEQGSLCFGGAGIDEALGGATGNLGIPKGGRWGSSGDTEN